MSFRNIGNVAILGLAALAAGDSPEQVPQPARQDQVVVSEERILELLVKAQAIIDRRIEQKPIQTDDLLLVFGQLYQRGCRDTEDLCQAYSIAEELISEFNKLDKQEQVELLRFVNMNLDSDRLYSEEKQYLQEHILALINELDHGTKLELDDFMFLASLRPKASSPLLAALQVYFGPSPILNRRFLLASLHAAN
ncbi:MAG: hypothetical protein OXU45_09525 [Candidatus Melainabacteria bacterium]|nr:hypothetical protein [Candidatus Melainabacteria bacterium]